MLYIISLNWNGLEKIKKLKDTLLPALKDIEYQWYIKDNGSQDKSIDELNSWQHPNINIIDYKHNRDNYAQGMNFLFKEASPKRNDDLILTLNNDIIFNDTVSLKNMINIIKKDKEVGGVGAKLNYTNNNTIQHNGVLFHHYNLMPYHYRSGAKEEAKDRQNRIFPAVTGALFLTTADIYRNCYTDNKSKNVGMNENFFWAFEDIDMNMRIVHHLKKKIVCCGQTNILHEESGTLKKNPINKMFMSQNCKLFLQYWRKDIEIGLEEKYQKSDKFNIYK